MALRYDSELDRIAANDPRYDAEAYRFLHQALEYTIQRFHKTNLPPNARHVSAQELLEGIRELGLQEFGPLTRFVFERWGIRRTKDWGEIVFNMVAGGVLGKSETDRKSDFQKGNSFRETFDALFRPKRKRKRNVQRPPTSSHAPNVS